METELEVKRINLGENNLGIPENTSRKLSYSIGGLFLLSSLFMFFDYLEEGTELFKHILYIGFYLVTGIVFLFRAQTALSETSKIVPHMIISGTGIEIKPSIFNKSQFIIWSDIKKIELRNLKIGLKLKHTNKVIYYSYKARKETSIEIKKLIGEIAVQKGIEVGNLMKI